MTPGARWVGLVALPLAMACAPSTYLVRAPPTGGFDAIVIPGCPSADDGSPSRCQLGRAGQAALLWRDGWTRGFIVSGSDVHTPYVEAEAIAQAMTLLGVPATRIWLERDALHTDENVYYSVLLARQAGFDRLAVVSYGPAASWMCRVMVQWGHTCAAISMDTEAIEQLLSPLEATLHALRARRVQPWEGLATREERIARVNGHGRPPSAWLYPLYPWIGASHRPIAPEHPALLTWAERLQQLP